MVSIELMKYLKNRATSQGITQKQIAKYFNVSIPTVKRWYSGASLSLEQANGISEYLGLTLGQALISIQSSTKTFQYNLGQERFFANNPDYLAYFDNLLNGNSVKQITKKFSLNNRNTSKYLIKLDKLDLIELHPNNKIKLLVSGEPVWSRTGPLSRSFKKDILDEFLEKNASVIDKFHLYEFSDEDINLIGIKVNELLQLTSQANNRATINGNKSKSYGFNVSLKEFRWSLDRFLK